MIGSTVGASVAIWIGLALTVASTAAAAYGMVQQNAAQEAALRYNAQQARLAQQQELLNAAREMELQNMLAAQTMQQAGLVEEATAFEARIREENARQALIAAEYEKQAITQEGTVARAAADVEEDNARRRLQVVQSEGKALIGASGVTSEGSPVLVLMENAAQTDLAIQRIRYGAGLREKAAETDAAMADYAGKLAARGEEIEGLKARRAGSLQANALRQEAAMIRYGAALRFFGHNRFDAGAGFDFQRQQLNAAFPYQLGSTILTGVGQVAGGFRYGGSSSGPSGFRYSPASINHQGWGYL